MLFVLLFSSCYSAAIVCTRNKNTNYFTKHKGDTSFFLPLTFMVYLDPCERILNDQLREEYSWLPDGYDIEYIIDNINGPPELKYCDKDIRGNKIISRKIWNLQHRKLCWSHVEKEKSIVYGEIFDDAYHHIGECCRQKRDFRLLLICLSVAAVVCLLIALVIFVFCLRGNIQNDLLADL